MEWTSALLPDQLLGSKLALKGSAKADDSLASVMGYRMLRRTGLIFQSSSAARPSSMYTVFLCMSHLPTTLSSLSEVPFSKF